MFTLKTYEGCTVPAANKLSVCQWAYSLCESHHSYNYLQQLNCFNNFPKAGEAEFLSHCQLFFLSFVLNYSRRNQLYRERVCTVIHCCHTEINYKVDTINNHNLHQGINTLAFQYHTSTNSPVWFCTSYATLYCTKAVKGHSSYVATIHTCCSVSLDFTDS